MAIPDSSTTSVVFPDLKRQKSFPRCGRLVVLEKSSGTALMERVKAPEDKFVGFAAINFPSMPDSIELSRSAEYIVRTPYGYPDGIHFYMGTSILKIPIRFKLHAYDVDYCKEGPKSILDTAALLHALVVPFKANGNEVKVQSGRDQKSTTAEKPNNNDANQRLGASKPTQPTGYQQPDVNPPATCYLELMNTTRQTVGIACVGYVQEVRVTLHGPFLRSQKPATAWNLPTMGEFEFTFIHHPGHGNSYGHYNQPAQQAFPEQQAFAFKIRERLYNTADLLTITSQDQYVGFNRPPIGPT
jgi:hypothetical protein